MALLALKAERSIANWIVQHCLRLVIWLSESYQPSAPQEQRKRVQVGVGTSHPQEERKGRVQVVGTSHPQEERKGRVQVVGTSHPQEEREWRVQVPQQQEGRAEVREGLGPKTGVLPPALLGGTQEL